MYLASKVARCNISSNTKETNMHAIASQWLEDHNKYVLPPFQNKCLNFMLHTEQNEWIYTLKYVYIHPYVPAHLKSLKRLIFRNEGSITFSNLIRLKILVKLVISSYDIINLSKPYTIIIYYKYILLKFIWEKDWKN